MNNFLNRTILKKNLLFIAHNEIMFSYIAPIYAGLKKDSRLRLWVCFFRPELFNPSTLKRLKKKFKFNAVPYKIARYLKWDLVFYPDHDPWFRKECKKIFIGHGIPMGKKNSNGNSYVYGPGSLDVNGEIIYDKFFESSMFLKELIKKNYQQFYPRVKVVGSLLADEMFREESPAITFKDKKNTKKTIMVTSTWGRDSLLISQGEKIIDQIKALKEKYNVIITVHQNNFLNKNSNNIDWRQELEKIQGDNVLVLTPEQNAYSFLPLADVLISDKTSLTAYYILLKRPIVFFDNFGDKYDAVTLAPEIRETLYCTKDLSNLLSHLDNSFKHFDIGKAQTLAEKVVSFLGESWIRYKEEIYDCLMLDMPDEERGN